MPLPRELKLCLLAGYYKDDAPTALKPKCRILLVIKALYVNEAPFPWQVVPKCATLPCPNVL